MIKSGQLFVLITLPCFHFPNPYIAENTHWRMQKFFIREGEALTAIREGLLQSFPKLPTKFSPLYASEVRFWYPWLDLFLSSKLNVNSILYVDLLVRIFVFLGYGRIFISKVTVKIKLSGSRMLLRNHNYKIPRYCVIADVTTTDYWARTKPIPYCNFIKVGDK